MRAGRLVSGAFAVALALAPTVALADDVDPNLQNARSFDLALFAPSAPGFTVLGLSPRRSADPGSFKTFGFDFADLSRGSDFDVGGALSFEPYWWGHDDLTLKEYQTETSWLERVFARTQASLAASFVDASPYRYYSFGVAAQAQLLDAQDERYDPHSYDCLLQAWQALRKPAEQAASDAVFDYIVSHPDATQADLDKVRNDALAKNGQASATAFANARTTCQDEAELRFLAQPSWIMGAGERDRTENTSFRGPRIDGGTVWTTYRQPVMENGLVSLEFFGVYTFSGTLDLLNNGPTSEAKGSEADVGAGVALERTWWKADAAFTYINQSFRSAALGTQSYGQVSVGGAIRIRQGLWLAVSGGNAFGGTNSANPFFGADIKYDWSGLGG